ncbi:MAG: enoyl-CoA hydratase/isomerase family protein [Pseudolabrys sp.]
MGPSAYGPQRARSARRRRILVVAELSEPEILFERRGASGLVTLNRPKALNAVTHGMVLALRAQLDDWGERSGGDAGSDYRRRRAGPSRPAATSAPSTNSALPDVTTTRCSSGATNIRSTPRLRIFANPLLR